VFWKLGQLAEGVAQKKAKVAVKLKVHIEVGVKWDKSTRKVFPNGLIGKNLRNSNKKFTHHARA
jgi:hypothetical protein